MVCRYCGSKRIYRSHRQGLYEGVWLRLVMKAPYRCHDCGMRYIASSSLHTKSKSGHEQSFAEFLGLRGRENRIRQWIIMVFLTIIFLAVSIIFLLRSIDL
jgi:hypothetical protein